MAQGGAWRLWSASSGPVHGGVKKWGLAAPLTTGRWCVPLPSSYSQDNTSKSKFFCAHEECGRT
eukprot:3357247-Pyramimonas_sp.AAC.1